MAGRRQRPPESHFVTDFPQTRGRGGKIFLYANELWSMSKDSIHLSYSGLLDSSGIFPGVKADAEAFGIYANEVPVESATIDSVSIGRFHLISLLNRSPLPRWHWEEGGGGARASNQRPLARSANRCRWLLTDFDWIAGCWTTITSTTCGMAPSTASVSCVTCKHVYAN